MQVGVEPVGDGLRQFHTGKHPLVLYEQTGRTSGIRWYGGKRSVVPVSDVLTQGEVDERIRSCGQHGQRSFLLFSIRSCFTWYVSSVRFRKKVTRKYPVRVRRMPM